MGGKQEEGKEGSGVISDSLAAGERVEQMEQEGEFDDSSMPRPGCQPNSHPRLITRRQKGRRSVKSERTDHLMVSHSQSQAGSRGMLGSNI